VISWHRFYDPTTGRYISADPIGLGGGINLYGYVSNDPVNLVDIFGLYTPHRHQEIDILEIDPNFGNLNLEEGGGAAIIAMGVVVAMAKLTEMTVQLEKPVECEPPEDPCVQACLLCFGAGEKLPFIRRVASCLTCLVCVPGNAGAD
jgi:uncharacterized protein RhaS with RHS repeats